MFILGYICPWPPQDSTSRDQETPKACDRMSGHGEMPMPGVWGWPEMVFIDQTRFHTAQETQGSQSTPQALITPSTLKKLIKH